jgi:anthranilate synthase
MWAVTLIGAPKKAAAQAIESLEKDARGWYGGAVGMITLNGDINTGILIRTTYLRDGMARTRPARRCSTIRRRRWKIASAI